MTSYNKKNRTTLAKTLTLAVLVVVLATSASAQDVTALEKIGRVLSFTKITTVVSVVNRCHY